MEGKPHKNIADKKKPHKNIYDLSTDHTLITDLVASQEEPSLSKEKH